MDTKVKVISIAMMMRIRFRYPKGSQRLLVAAAVGGTSLMLLLAIVAICRPAELVLPASNLHPGQQHCSSRVKYWVCKFVHTGTPGTPRIYYLRYAGVIIRFVFLNATPIFDLCTAQWGSKNKHHQDTCVKEVGLCLKILLNYSHSILSTIGRTHVFNAEINKHNTYDNHN